MTLHDVLIRSRPVANRSWVAMAATTACLAGAALAASSRSSVLTLTVVCALTVGQWMALQWTAGQSVPLPGIAVVGLNAVGVLGWLYYPSIADRAAVSTVLPATPLVYDTAALIFAVASGCIFLGGILGGGRRPAEIVRTFDHVQQAAALTDRVLSGWLAAVAALPLCIQVIAYSPAGLLHRAHYSDTVVPEIVVIAGTILTPVGMALAALLLFRDEHPGTRQVGGLLVGGYLLVLFSMGTRQLSMLPIMVLLAWLLRHRGDRSGVRTATIVGLALAVTLIFLQLPLSMRNMASGSGFIPYLDALTTSPGVLLAFDAPRILGNVLFSVPLAGTAAHLPPFPQSWFLTSINPLPSAFTDWTAIKGGLRLNIYTPTSGLGELKNYSILHLAGGTALLGFTLARIQAWNLRLPPARAALATVVGIGLTGATVLNLMQYNLRTGARDIWYLVLISVLLHLWKREPGSGRE